MSYRYEDWALLNDLLVKGRQETNAKRSTPIDFSDINVSQDWPTVATKKPRRTRKGEAPAITITEK